MQVIRPPDEIPFGTPEYTIFLAGSIEMDTAANWQEETTKQLADLPGIILNPRRLNWDASWEQKFENRKFHEQVTWELDALDTADRIFMYFDPNTKSPISLLELGLYATSRKLVVCCPTGFWRKGNVDIVCERYEIQTVRSLDDLKGIVEFDLQLDNLFEVFSDETNRTESPD